MKQQILNSAITEFGNNSYTTASLNSISKNAGISKGVIYHYFQNKDDLYLECVSVCFNEFVKFFNRATIDRGDVKNAIEDYIKRHYQFFKNQPEFLTIFTNALFQPPLHLLDSIKNIKTKLDEFNIDFYKKVLHQIKLREGISTDEAIDYFIIFQESFNYYFQNKKNLIYYYFL